MQGCARRSLPGLSYGQGDCLPSPRLRFEVASSGVDEALQGSSSDVFNASVATGAGLRVPLVVPGGSPTPRYLFLLATRQVQHRTRLTGIGQLVTIGTSAPAVAEGTAPSRPLEVNVTTPTFRFPDGNISWHLVIEPNIRTVITRPLTDAANFMFQEADGPALLYSTAAYSAGNFNPITGAPAIYPVGLTAYTPPTNHPMWRPLGGLGCFYDLRFPWDSDHIWDSLDIPIEVESNVRISFYASVLQTAGSAFGTVTYPSPVVDLPPEEGFISNNWPNGVFYWRVGGRMIFEDELETADCQPCGPKGQFVPPTTDKREVARSSGSDNARLPRMGTYPEKRTR